ncbi:BolA family protein [Alteromonas sp. a30]|uniref:BolA family protein n=1 Tax=Alteromonas sp. a30 TaxID=2730917 RepID=UPI002283295B|nr:BolA family protein [Alteromonas sp. a30]MCY7294814.1 BolA family transcriptional regulator [Alteromonas sp. a30]
MQAEDIKKILEDKLALDEIHVTGEGSHFQILAVSDAFEGMSRVKKQQMIYAPLNEFIADGTLHALSIKTFNQEQWQKDKKLLLPDA